jgi:hypothetical protein
VDSSYVPEPCCSVPAHVFCRVIEKTQAHILYPLPVGIVASSTQESVHDCRLITAFEKTFEFGTVHREDFVILHRPQNRMSQPPRAAGVINYVNALISCDPKARAPAAYSKPVKHASKDLLPNLLPPKNKSHFFEWANLFNYPVLFMVRTVGLEPTWLLTAGT